MNYFALQATDPDAGDYGRVEYFNFGEKNFLFSLNTGTGDIRVSESLMAYAGQTFKLLIGARDNLKGKIRHNASKHATVVIKVYEASIDVLCVSTIPAPVMKIKAEFFRR